MPLIVDDAFYEYAREHSLPDCSVSFLVLAGSWSARNSRSGFVPSSMLASFSDDPDLVTRTLCAGGFVRRVRGGVRLAAGRGLTVVNASDVLRDIEQDKADAEQRRAVERERKRRYRTAKAAERREDSVPRVPPESRGTSTGVPPDVPPNSPGNPEKPQVKGGDVPRDIRGTSDGTSRGTPQIDRSDLSPVSRSRSRSKSARTRGPAPGSQEFRLQVIAKFGAVAKAAIGPETADTITADVLGARKHVDNPLLYVLAAIENDPDPKARWLPEQAPPPPEKHAVPDWCGECYRADDRSVYDDNGRLVGPCPRCSPKPVPAWEVA